MSKLTSRESFLIYFMVCVAIIVGALFFIISPFKKLYDAAAEQKEVLAQQKLSMNLSIADGVSRQSELDTLKENMDKTQKSFFKDISEDDIDSTTTSMLKKYNLQPLSLVISLITEEDDESETTAETTEEETSPELSYFKKYKASAEARGDLASMYSLINELAGNTKLIISDYQIQQKDGTYYLNLDLTYIILTE
ncbi:MAG TPA: hypothetical protein PKI60_05180 [Oscillospiraceae bacterium]|nr:hypothetical protein [Oscillospiraceae bacterium]